MFNCEHSLGYSLSSKAFYSWLGGVLPEFRGNGIATRLRCQQEQWAIDRGYKQLSVKSGNRFPVMMQMLISSGYQISNYEDKGSLALSKVHFIKNL